MKQIIDKEVLVHQVVYDMESGLPIDRWFVYRNYKLIKAYMKENNFKHLLNNLRDVYESAKESI